MYFKAVFWKTASLCISGRLFFRHLYVVLAVIACCGGLVVRNVSSSHRLADFVEICLYSFPLFSFLMVRCGDVINGVVLLRLSEYNEI